MNALLVAILAWFSVNSCFKGFVKTIFSILSFGASVILAFLLTSPFSTFLIDKKAFDKEISSVVSVVLRNQSELFIEEKVDSKEKMIALIYSTEAPYFTKSVLEQMVDGVDFSGAFSVAEIVSPIIYCQTIKIISFVFLLFLFLLLLKILQSFLSRFLKFFNLQATDKALGFLFGVVLGLFVYCVLVCLIIFLANIFGSDYLIKKINEGAISSLIYQNFGDKILSFF